MLDQAALYYYGFIAILLAASIIVGKIAGPIATRLLEALAGRTKSTLDDRIIAAVKGPVESCLFLMVFYFLLHYFPELAAAATVLERYTYALLIVIATYTASEASGAFIRWYYDEGHKLRRMGVDLSLLPLVRKVTKIAIYIVGLTIALSATGFDVTALIAVTSVAGIVIALASQETLGNIFAGIALQLDRPYHYGDYLRLPFGEIAIIRKIGMRTTRLEDLCHNTVIVSNSEFAKMRVTNLSLPDEVMLVPVAAEVQLGTDLAKLDRAITLAFEKEKPEGLLSDKRHAISIDSVKAGSMAITVSFWAKGYRNAEKIKGIVNEVLLQHVGGQRPASLLPPKARQRAKGKE